MSDFVYLEELVTRDKNIDSLVDASVILTLSMGCRSNCNDKDAEVLNGSRY